MAWLIALLAAMPGFTGYVVDPAGVIGAPEAARISAVAARLDKAGVAQIAVAAVSDLGGMDRKQYANELFQKWKLGHGAKADDGLLILILAGPAGHRGLKVEVGYGLEGRLPDGKVGALIDQAAGPSMRAGQFGKAAAALVERLAAEIDGVPPAPSAAAPLAPSTAAPLAPSAAAPTAPAPAPVAAAPQAAVEKPRRLRDYSLWPLFLVEAVLFGFYFAQRQPGLRGALALAAALLVGAAGAQGMLWAWFVALAIPLPMLVGGFWHQRCPKDGGWLEDTRREVIPKPKNPQLGVERITRVCKVCGFTRVVEGDTVPIGGSSGWSSGGTGGSSGGSSGGSGSSGGFSGGGGGRSGGGGADRDY